MGGLMPARTHTRTHTKVKSQLGRTEAAFSGDIESLFIQVISYFRDETPTKVQFP